MLLEPTRQCDTDAPASVIAEDINKRVELAVMAAGARRSRFPSLAERHRRLT